MLSTFLSVAMQAAYEIDLAQALGQNAECVRKDWTDLLDAVAPEYGFTTMRDALRCAEMRTSSGYLMRSGLSGLLAF